MWVQFLVNKGRGGGICEVAVGLAAKVKRLKTSTEADRHC